mgnify:CR=1 FL=1
MPIHVFAANLNSHVAWLLTGIHHSTPRRKIVLRVEKLSQREVPTIIFSPVISIDDLDWQICCKIISAANEDISNDAKRRKISFAGDQEHKRVGIFLQVKHSALSVDYSVKLFAYTSVDHLLLI